eukprot:CAMPEP_0178412462 /NCGR_PEP_ID=MMETSP0689_2-20121128/22028_1 /TAXON_ID=160604 /ORGANISM="Amphidinium massartii, Strain CS-259" /LENGTH=490 /DNA_ID=CAMNT_0020033711 /DNA_START=66 /DNA_END=1540 /DNA_ORIENTATION=+
MSCPAESEAQLYKIVWDACEAVCSGISCDNGVDDSIFELGIDSLGLSEVLIQLEALLGEGCIAVDDVMQEPTVTAIVAKLASGGKVAASVQQSPAIDLGTKAIVWKACESVCQGVSAGDQSSTSIFELGIDSLGLSEMLIKLEVSFGDGCITVDEVMQLPTVDAIVDLLQQKGANLTVHAGREATQRQEEEAAAGADAVCETDAGPAAVPLAWMASFRPLGPGEWVRCTHIGSLPRGNSDTRLEDIIRHQAEAGVDWINDGEWTRENYISDMLSRLMALEAHLVEECLCDMPCAADMHDVPVFRRRFTGGNGLITLNPDRVAQADVACIGPVVYRNKDSLHKSLQPFLDAIGVRPRDTCFWSVPSPGTLAVFCEDQYYGDVKAFTSALAEAVKQEYEAVAASGLVLQVDGPDLAMGRHTRHAGVSDEEWEEIMRAEWVELHTRLNGGKPVAPEQQLPSSFQMQQAGVCPTNFTKGGSSDDSGESDGFIGA